MKSSSRHEENLPGCVVRNSFDRDLSHAPTNAGMDSLGRLVAFLLNGSLLQYWFDLPGRAEAKVTFHLFNRRVLPSSKEGNVTPFARLLDSSSMLTP